MVNIKLLFVIVDEGSYKKVNNVLNKFGIIVKTINGATGTASPSLLDFFGLIESRKEIYMAVIPDYLENDILLKLDAIFDFDKEGTGIAFVLPIASSNKYLSDYFEKEDIERTDKVVKKSEEAKFYLIVTIVLEGYLEQVMNASKRAGSSGGTAIKGRGLANLTKGKILGFNIEPEKDIVLNIVEANKKNKVMEEITKEVGIKTPGKGVCIALPVDSTIGISSFDEC